MTAPQRVPDDPSALDADRWRLYEEWARTGKVRHAPDAPASEHHPARWRDGLPWFGRHGSRTLPLVFMAAGVAAMIAVLILPLWDRPDRPPETAALAVTSATPGTVGGLLPATAVSVNGSPRNLRDIRPAAFLVVPPECVTCAGLALSVDQAVSSAHLRMVVAGGPQAQQAVADTAAAVSAPRVEVPAEALSTFPATAPFVVVVGRHGVITGVFPTFEIEAIAAAGRDDAEQ